MPTWILIVCLASGLSVLGIEAAAIRRVRRRPEVRVEESVRLAPAAASEGLVRWLDMRGNPLGSRTQSVEGSGAVRFLWGRRQDLAGQLRVEPLPSGGSRVSAVLDRRAKVRALTTLALLLVLVPGLPLAAGVPLLVFFLSNRPGLTIGVYWILAFCVHLYWPLHPVVLLWQEEKKLRGLLETALANLEPRARGPSR